MKGKLIGATIFLAATCLVFLTGCGDRSPCENRSPVASFTCNPSFGEAPLSVTFDASASSDPDGFITSYVWSFGDGESGSGITTSHTYTVPRTYAIQLTVTDDDETTHPTTQTIYVSPAPEGPDEAATRETTVTEQLWGGFEDYSGHIFVAPSPLPGEPVEASIGIPEYEIINEEDTDVPLKSQVVIEAVVSGNITEDGLGRLLLNLYQQARAKRDFLRYHSEVTNVYIYLFQSREYAASGYQWLAMLDKSYGDTSPKITISDDRLSLFLNPPSPETRFGLAEEQRMEVFKEIVRAEDRATDESMARYPDLVPGDPGYSQDAFMEQLQKQMDEQDRLTDKYKNELANQYGITRDELSQIASEGINKNWPMPAYGE